MDPMVSARVPLPLKNAVNRELKTIGSSPTELINKAYEYFLVTKQLPESEGSLKPGIRKIDATRRKQLRSMIDRTTYPVPESYFGNRSYDQILEDELRNSYEALS